MAEYTSNISGAGVEANILTTWMTGVQKSNPVTTIHRYRAIVIFIIRPTVSAIPPPQHPR